MRIVVLQPPYPSMGSVHAAEGCLACYIPLHPLRA